MTKTLEEFSSIYLVVVVLFHPLLHLGNTTLRLAFFSQSILDR